MTEIADSLETLEIHHLSICTNDSTEDDKNMRGIIKDGDNIVCRSFPHTPEVLHTDTEGIETYIKPFVENKVRAFKSFEGTILRVWNYKGEWKISTHRRIDAFKSRWGSNKSYGETFTDTLISQLGLTSFAEYCKELQPNYTYVFLMRNGKNNRIVCNAFAEPFIFIVGKFDRDTEWTYTPGRNCTECKVPSSEQVEYSSLEELLKLVETVPTREYQGVIMISDEGKSVKLVNATYDRMIKIRNNCPNILTRFVQLNYNSEAISDLECFKQVYEEQHSEFVDVENVIADIIKNVHRKYMLRYVQNKVAVVPNDQYLIIKDLHKKHQENRNFKVTPDSVKSHILSLTPGHIVFLYENYKKRRTELGNGNFVPQEVRNKIYNGMHDWK